MTGGFGDQTQDRTFEIDFDAGLLVADSFDGGQIDVAGVGFQLICGAGDARQQTEGQKQNGITTHGNPPHKVSLVYWMLRRSGRTMREPITSSRTVNPVRRPT